MLWSWPQYFYLLVVAVIYKLHEYKKSTYKIPLTIHRLKQKILINFAQFDVPNCGVVARVTVNVIYHTTVKREDKNVYGMIHDNILLQNGNFGGNLCQGMN